MSTSLTAEPLIYTERTDDDEFEPTLEDIEEFAKRIGINISSEPELLYLAREGLRAPLPDGWKPCRQKTRDRDVWFYYNSKTHVSQWEHPMDPVYRNKVIQARSELAMNKIQSFDPLTMRPPKSLPPLKRTGASLSSISPAVSSLGKLGGFGPAAGDLRQTAPNSSLSNSFHNTKTNNNGSLQGRVQTNSNSIISGSTLNSFKDTDDDDDDSVRFMRPQRKSGLTLTGGGANFLKGSEGFAKTKIGVVPPGNGSLDFSDPAPESDNGGAGDSDKRPIKSILVNSISRSRPTNPSDNVYELDGFSMNLDEMTDEEKMVLSQLESTTTSRSKGNVKFNLDENTELKFEMSGDENEDNDPNQNQQQSKDDTDESERNDSNSPGALRHSGINHTGRANNNLLSNNVALINKGFTSKDETAFIPQYSEEDIAAMKKAMRDEMEAELNKFKEQLEEERKIRQEQIQKHLEETVTQFKLEKEDTIKRLKRDMESEKTFEVDKAKREIDSLLQTELVEMKMKFDNALQARQRELEEEHQKKIDALTAEFRKNEEEKVSVALRQQVSEEVAKSAEAELKRQKESMREEHKRQLAQMKDYHKTIIEKLQAELLAEEEQLRRDHMRKQAEIVAKFEQDTEELKKRLIQSQKETLEKIQAEFEIKKASLEETLTASLQDIRDRLYQNKRSASDTNISDKAAEDELRFMKAKYQQLENKYKTMKQELQHLSQEMLARKSSVINNSTADQRLSLRSSRPLTKGITKLTQMNESFDVSDTNQDSAHGSESNTDSNSSRYPSSDGIGRQTGDKKDEPILPATPDSPSQANRINAALQALEILKQEILDLKESNSKKQTQQETPLKTVESGRKVPYKSTYSTPTKTSSARRPSKYDISSPHDTLSARKKSSSVAMSSKSARVKVSSPSPPTHDTSTDTHPPPKFVSRSVSVVPQDLSGPHSEPISEDTHQRIVEDAKAFIRMQKNRLKDPSPIPNSSHLILPTTKNNLLLFDERLLKSVSPRRPTSIHLDLVSETESSGVSSLKDHRSSESKKLSKDIDEICHSLISLDQQMKLMWSVVKDKQQQPYYQHQDESPLLNTNSGSNFTALLPNTMPIILGKSTRVCASLPTSARKPLVPTSAMINSAGLIPSGSIPARNYSSLLSNSQNSSSQTVLDALRMSGLSTTRLDCTDLLKSLEEELKEFKSTKQRLLDIQESLTTDDKKTASPRHKNNNSNILAKTKDLQEWIKKY